MRITYGTANYSSGRGVFIEKAFLFDFLKRVIVSPGLSFKTINEEFQTGGMGLACQAT